MEEIDNNGNDGEEEEMYYSEYDEEEEVEYEYEEEELAVEKIMEVSERHEMDSMAHSRQGVAIPKKNSR